MSNCEKCSTPSAYAKLGNMNEAETLPACLNRFNCERSVKDQLYYKIFVLNEPIQPYHK